MATVIDSLVLELGIDSSKFTEGQKAAVEALRKTQEEMEKGGKNTDAQGKRLEEYFGRLKGQALGLLGAFFGARGLSEFVQKITTMDAATSRLSKTLNMSTTDLSTWQGVARRTGGTAESISGTMQGLTDQISNFQLGIGNPGFLAPLNALGVSLKDNNGKFKTASELLVDINRAVQGMDPARARAMMTAIGIDGATINTLLLTEKTLKSMLEEQKRLAIVQEQSARSSEDLAKAWSEAEQSAESYGRTLLQKLTPALTKALEWST